MEADVHCPSFLDGIDNLLNRQTRNERNRHFGDDGKKREQGEEDDIYAITFEVGYESL